MEQARIQHLSVNKNGREYNPCVVKHALERFRIDDTIKIPRTYISEYINLIYGARPFLLYPKGFTRRSSILESIYLDSIFGCTVEERIRDEYRKFIEENRFRRIKSHSDFRPLSIQWSQCTKSNRNTIKYAP